MNRTQKKTLVLLLGILVGLGILLAVVSAVVMAADCVARLVLPERSAVPCYAPVGCPGGEDDDYRSGCSTSGCSTGCLRPYAPISTCYHSRILEWSFEGFGVLCGSTFAVPLKGEFF